ALQRLARNPPETLLVATAEPIDAVRGAMLLKAAIPAIQIRARSLRQEIDGLERVRAEIGGEMERFTQANAGLARERKRLDTLLAAKAAMQNKTDAQRDQTAKQVAALTQKAATLRELFERLEEAAPAPPPSRPDIAPPSRPSNGPAPTNPPATLPSGPPPQGVRSFPADGTVTMPVQGRMTERYGQATGFGGTSKGLSFSTRESAQVVAPYDGRVMFAGPFRGYGQILIIEHRGGYHTLLAGLQRVDGQVGQWVLAGEPVGVMGSEGTPTLYVELRRNGQPINPLPWFAADTNKVRG
ncbi:MAG: murein hydrolase activator EnvC, partial [Alphaproteobacteria bacterium]